MNLINGISNRLGGKDQNPHLSAETDNEFTRLFTEVMEKLKSLSTVTDATTLTFELNKIRKSMRKLIDKYFHPGLLEFSVNRDHAESVRNFKSRLDAIYDQLELRKW